MDIDFNHVRRLALDSYAALVKELNRHIDDDGINDLQIEDISDILDDLRSALVGIICTFETGNEDFKVVLKDNEIVPIFNPKDDE